MGTDGTQHLAALDPKSQVLCCFFLSNHQKSFSVLEWWGSNKIKVEWETLGKPGYFNKFTKVASPAWCTAEIVQVWGWGTFQACIPAVTYNKQTKTPFCNLRWLRHLLVSVDLIHGALCDTSTNVTVLWRETGEGSRSLAWKHDLLI